MEWQEAVLVGVIVIGVLLIGILLDQVYLGNVAFKDTKEQQKRLHALLLTVVTLTSVFSPMSFIFRWYQAYIPFWIFQHGIGFVYMAVCVSVRGNIATHNTIQQLPHSPKSDWFLAWSAVLLQGATLLLYVLAILTDTWLWIACLNLLCVVLFGALGLLSTIYGRHILKYLNSIQASEEKLAPNVQMNQGSTEPSGNLQVPGQTKIGGQTKDSGATADDSTRAATLRKERVVSSRRFTVLNAALCAFLCLCSFGVAVNNFQRSSATFANGSWEFNPLVKPWMWVVACLLAIISCRYLVVTREEHQVRSSKAKPTMHASVMRSARAAPSKRHVAPQVKNSIVPESNSLLPEHSAAIDVVELDDENPVESKRLSLANSKKHASEALLLAPQDLPQSLLEVSGS